MSLKPDFLSVVRHSVTLRSHIRLLRLKSCFRVAVSRAVNLLPYRSVFNHRCDGFVLNLLTVAHLFD